MPSTNAGDSSYEHPATTDGAGYVIVDGCSYDESPAFVDGISVFGGYNPVTWEPSESLTEVRVGTTAATATSIDTPTTLRRLKFVARDNPTGNSIAFQVSSSSGALKFELCAFEAGSGGPGAAGAAAGAVG